jgi:hypothetical protein
MKSIVFWEITPCSPLKVNGRFGGTYRLVSCSAYSSTLKMEAMFLWNIGLSTDYTASYPRRQNSTLILVQIWWFWQSCAVRNDLPRGFLHGLLSPSLTPSILQTYGHSGLRRPVRLHSLAWSSTKHYFLNFVQSELAYFYAQQYLLRYNAV